MAGLASIQPSPVSASLLPAILGVYRRSGDGQLELLPNIRVLSIQSREGASPGSARFRYVFDPADPSTDPTSFEQALAVDCSLVNVVRNDERLVVLRFEPDGSLTPLFDGFAQVPELTLSSSQELVTFLAFGVAVREWDSPIAGAWMRDADVITDVSDVETDLPVFFNPQGRPNATPEGCDSSNDKGESYPVFLDPLVVRTPDVRRAWTLSMVVRYLCFRENPDEIYVDNPDGDLIDTLLDARSPIAGVSMNGGDSSTYNSESIASPSYYATGKAWPTVLHDLLEPNGFGMAFRLESNASGDLRTRLDVFRRQDNSTTAQKDLFLQPSRNLLDSTKSNLSAARLVRDTSRVANIFRVHCRPTRYEASFILAPGFPIASRDASSPSAILAFDRSDPSFSQTLRDAYRLYVFDETGEGHWDFKSSTLVHTATPLNALFECDEEVASDCVKRRRAPIAELFTKDPNQRPLSARLAISTDYTGTAPGLWNGKGTWQNVVGGFELLDDRLGIWISAVNPNGWNIGLPSQAGLPYPSGIVKGVEDQALPTATHFTLRLTCVIEGDYSLDAIADQRPSSSTAFGITRLIDRADRYFRQVICPSSEFNLGSEPLVDRDDTDLALAEATARRLAMESGEVAGTVTIPRFTTCYEIGDRIRSILGRDLSLKTNAGAPDVEGDVFPAVVGVRWEFEAKQQTILDLSDHRGR